MLLARRFRLSQVPVEKLEFPRPMGQRRREAATRAAQARDNRLYSIAEGSVAQQWWGFGPTELQMRVEAGVPRSIKNIYIDMKSVPLVPYIF